MEEEVKNGEGVVIAINPAEGEEKSPKELFLEKLRSKYPDMGDDENEQYSKAMEHMSNMEEVGGRYDKMMETNKELADRFMQDPRAASALTAFMQGKPLPVALKEYFDEEELTMKEGDEGWEQYLEAEKSKLAAMEESQAAKDEFVKNITDSEGAIQSFMKDKGMNEEEFDTFMGKIVDAVTNKLYKGIIDSDFLETFYKGLNYDTEVASAEAAGKVAGRNEKIVAERKRPDMPDAAVAGAATEQPRQMNRTERFFGGMISKNNENIWDRGKK